MAIAQEKIIQDDLSQVLQSIVEGLADIHCDEPFDSLTARLAQATGADFAFIAEIQQDQLTAQTLSFFAQGKHTTNFEYELPGTPCIKTITADHCVFARDVQGIFPHASCLQRMQAETFIGTRLASKGGNTMGLIAIVHQSPVENHELLAAIQKLFAEGASLALASHRRGQSQSMLERQLNSILSITQEAIIATDENSNIILFSKGAELIFGYEAEEVLGQSVNILLPDHARQKHQQQMQGFLESNESSRLMTQRNGDIKAMRKDGSIFPAEASITKSRTADEVTVTVVLRDITERQQSQRALQSATRMQTLGNLAAGLAHDFNNILTLIQGSLDLVSPRARELAEDRHYFEVAQKATARGAELVSRLLAFGRPRTLSTEIIDPSKLIQQLVGMLRVTLGAHITVEFTPCKSECKVLVDPSQLENALVNLSFNARDAMKSGGTLRIVMNCLDYEGSRELSELDLEPGRYVQIQVIDTGEGMDAAMRHKAGEAFVSTKLDTGGSGLGLSMVQGFVRSAHGAMRISSEPGQGTTIDLFLPSVSKQTTNTIATNEDSKAKPKTILIVEDQPDVRELAVQYAKTLGYDVLDAEDGPKALALIEQHPEIDLLFTDYQLPGGHSGLDLANHFSTVRPDAKVLISSGYDTQAIDLAKFMLLPKPYSLQIFDKTLRKLFKA